MKRLELIKILQRNGWWMDREGSRHSIFTNGKDVEPIGRHSEIKDTTAKSIINRRRLK